MIFLLYIYLPDILSSGSTIDYVVDRYHGGKHGMILVVVLVHPVSPVQVQVLNIIQVLSNNGQAIIAAEIRRICLWHPDQRRREPFPVTGKIKAEPPFYAEPPLVRRGVRCRCHLADGVFRNMAGDTTAHSAVWAHGIYRLHAGCCRGRRGQGPGGALRHTLAAGHAGTIP